MPTSKPRPGFSPPIGVLLKLGTYGLLRFGLAYFQLGNPGSLVSNPAVCFMGLYGDRSKGYEKMVAYSSIGHMGYVPAAAARL